MMHFFSFSFNQSYIHRHVERVWKTYRIWSIFNNYQPFLITLWYWNEGSTSQNAFNGIHARCVHDKYTFFYKVVYILIVFTLSYLTVYVRAVKDGRCKSKIRDTLTLQKQRPQDCNFIKKETLAQVLFCEFCEISKNIFFTDHLWRRYFPVNFVKFPRTSFLQNTSGRLLLPVQAEVLLSF